MDIFALGVILHQLVTGGHPEPFGADASTTDDPREYHEPSAIVARSAMAGHASVAIPGALARDLDAVVLKALAGDPGKRYASVEALSRDLQALIESRPVGARPGTLTYRAVRFVRRNRALTAAVTIAVLSTMGAIASLAYLWKSASTERAAAVQRFEQLSALATSLFDVDEALARVPGTTSARDALNRSLASYLAGLRESAAGDVRLLLHVAESYRRLGDVQGNPHNPNLGDARRALASYGAAVEILEALRHGHPPDRSQALALAETLAARADVLVATGQPDEGVADYQQALRIAVENARESDAPPREQELQARLHRSLGDAAFARGDPAVARASYDQALQVERALTLRFGETSERRRLMALSRLRSAAVMEQQQAWVDAHAQYDAAIEALRSLNASEPATAGLLRDTAVALTRFAALIRLSDEAGAQARVKEAIEILRPLVGKDAADARVRRDLSRALLQYGDLLATSDRARAQAYYREAREQAEMLRAAVGDDAQLESELRIIRARIASGAGPPRAALRLFTMANGRREPLAEKGMQPPPVTQRIIAAASAPAGWSRYLIAFGAEGTAELWDDSQSVGGEWTLPILGPPPAQTLLLLALPRRLSADERKALIAEISAVPGPRAVDWDSQILWTSDADDTVLSTASPRGALDLEWMRAVRGKLEGLRGAKFAGHTFPIAPPR
jgi:eukaryotic-like serine/threonine-protein kinase